MDLGEGVNISSLDVYFDHQDDAYARVPKSVTYQVSDDGADWFTVLSKSVLVPAEGGFSAMEPQKVPVGSRGRHLRLLFEDGPQATDIALLQVTVWATDGGCVRGPRPRALASGVAENRRSGDTAKKRDIVPPGPY